MLKEDVSIKFHAKVLIFFTLLSSQVLFATQLSITVDDLPSSGSETINMSKTIIASKIIETLKSNKIPEVYGFVNAKLVKNMPEHQEILKQWKAAGYLLGNHTYSHLDYVNSSTDDFILDIEKNESTLIDYASNIKEIKVFRYPFLNEGENNLKRYALRSYLSKRNYRIAQVTIDFEDWAWLAPLNRCLAQGLTHESSKIQELKKSYLDHAMLNYSASLKNSEIIWGRNKIKHILLLHLNAPTSLWLGDLLKQLKTMKVKFISSKDALRDSFYDEDTTYNGTTGKTFIMQALETRRISLKNIKIPVTPKTWLSEQCPTNDK